MQRAFSKAFLSATGLLPERLWRGCFSIPEKDRLRCEEIRIRVGRPLTALIGGKSVTLHDEGKQILVTQEDADQFLAQVTGSSVHTYMDQIARGYITAAGGHRIGICGESVRDGTYNSFRCFSSFNLRIAKQAVGLSDRILARLPAEDFKSTLIISPPGGGKTTLLRDMCRALSYSHCVSIADERYEIAACKRGVPQFDVGSSDIISGSDKSYSINTLLKAMNPRIIALDEITAAEDVDSLIRASYCGCDFIATAHGDSVDSLTNRPVYRQLMQENIFRSIIVIDNQNETRQYRIWKEGEENDKNNWIYSDSGIMLGNRIFHELKAQ